MDNFKIDVVSSKYETFALAMDIALKHWRAVSHYAVIDYKAESVNEWLDKPEKRKTMLLFWHDDESFKPRPTPLPYKMKDEVLVSFVWHWLEDYWENDPHSEPDHDGSNSHGWRVFNEEWGHVAGSHYGVVGVQPVWAMHGK